MLMDVCSKVFSSVMNDCAFRLLELHSTQFQFGGTPEIGCQDGLFTLKALLNAQHNHNLGSYVGFVDLVKAYDMANHELLFRLLEKYGHPPLHVLCLHLYYVLHLPSRPFDKTNLTMDFAECLSWHQEGRMQAQLFLRASLCLLTPKP
jgi:hypothetical protein